MKVNYDVQFKEIEGKKCIKIRQSTKIITLKNFENYT